MIEGRERLRAHCEILFFLERIDKQYFDVHAADGNDTKDENIGNDLAKILDEIVAKAKARGFEKMEEQRAKVSATILLGGAGQAHKAASVDNALPPLRLVIPPIPDKGTT